jgi:hypothetical protein
MKESVLENCHDKQQQKTQSPLRIQIRGKKKQSRGRKYGWLEWLETLLCRCGDHRTRHGKDAYVLEGFQ